MDIIRTWLRVCFGHPRNALITIGIVLACMTAIWPRTMGGFFSRALISILNALGLVFQSFFASIGGRATVTNVVVDIGVLVIAFLGFRMMWRAFVKTITPPKKKKGGH